MVAVVLLSIVAAAFWNYGTAPIADYVWQPVRAGDLVVRVTARGNLHPIQEIDVGTEISGTVRSIAVDVNAEVKAGQLLARLDTSTLDGQALHAQSSLASAKARALQAVARLTQVRSSYDRLQRVRELSGNKLPSKQQLDVAESALAQADAQEVAARAAVAQARANLMAVAADLHKTEIRSPIDGVVLVRSVERGQTVAASLQSPVLFRLAGDLGRMQLRVAVDEADIGSVQVGQTATFTVDAFPNRMFAATIERVDFASNRTRKSLSEDDGGAVSAGSSASTGSVTYQAVLKVDNSELLLRPGMTATAEIVTGTIRDATLVPNSAMYYTPDRAQFPTADDQQRGKGIVALMPHVAERWRCPRENGQALGCVWVLHDREPQLAIFKPGATDRSFTQALPLEQLPNWSSLAPLRNDPVFRRAVGRSLNPGTRVIVDTAQAVSR